MTIGGIIGMILFAAVADTMGWRMSFYIVGGISLVVSLLSLLLPDNKKLMDEQAAAAAAEGDKNEVKQVKLNLADTFKMLLGNKSLLIMCFAAGFAVMTLNISSTFQSTYFVEGMGMSLTEAAAIATLSTPISLIVCPLGGVVLDKWYKKDRRARMWMPMICIAVTAVLLCLGYKMGNIPMIVLGTAAYNMGNTSFHTSCHDLVPVWYKSVSYGVYVLFIQLLGAAGPILGGILIDAMGIGAAMPLGMTFFAISAVLLIFAGLTYNKCWQAARDAEKAAGLCEE